ncbi:gamma-glutamylcyclotransferase family protein [Inhella sp.]|uniref:gamma-glutamylcyclotransferase family protein n=1 Tax=Inhella sp. TaxID=1921806 RepID=UPI0035B3D132
MSHLIFVYGTLKQGFRNHHINHGERLPGVFHTVAALPLYVVGPNHLPWLVNAPGQGEPVAGELYRVDDAGLARMDELEQIERPDWYLRQPLQVRGEDGRVWDCEVYFGAASRLQLDPVHLGPVPAYTQEHAALRERALAAG